MSHTCWSWFSYSVTVSQVSKACKKDNLKVRGLGLSLLKYKVVKKYFDRLDVLDAGPSKRGILPIGCHGEDGVEGVVI